MENKEVKEQPILFKTAKLAKDVGLDISCEKYYYYGSFAIKDKYSLVDKDWVQDRLVSNTTCAAPTQSLFQKILRKKHRIDVIPTMSEFSRTYGYKIYYIEDGQTRVINQMFTKHETYEQALESGLYKALKLLRLITLIK